MFKGDERPVEHVTWYDAVDYCNALSQIEGRTSCYRSTGDKVTWQWGCSGYRLPSEAEWEYAARAGTNMRYAGAAQPEKLAWFGEDKEGQTRPVKQKEPNRWGLYDLSGNVSEWVWDCFADDYGQSQRVAGEDPTGPIRCTQPGRVARGGAVWSAVRFVRVAARSRVTAGTRGASLGFLFYLLPLCRRPHARPR